MQGPDRISCHAALERTACAPFHEERRMKLIEATKFHRKSGGGPAAKREPSPEGLGVNSEHDLSAVGAALNLGPLAPVSLGANSGFPTTLLSKRPRMRLSLKKAA